MLAAQPAGDLYSLYQAWVDCLLAREAWAVTGAYSLVRAPVAGAGAVAADHPIASLLATHDRLTRALAKLRAEAERETQLARRVDLNLEIKRLEAERAALLEACR